MTLLVLLACSPHPRPDDVDPHVSSGWVIDALDEVSWRAQRGEVDGAREALVRALDEFERRVEPALRRRTTEREVAKAEYAFARLDRAIGSKDAGAAPPVVSDLVLRLRRVLPPPDSMASTAAPEGKAGSARR